MIDLHQDLYLYQQWPEFYPNDNQVNLKQIRDFKTKLVVASAFCGPDKFSMENFQVTEKEMWEQALLYYSNLPNDEWYLVKNWSDTQQTENQNKTGIIFHLEGIYQDISLDELESWYKKGLRSIGLTWADSSPFAGGNKDRGAGLTNNGRRIIEWCLVKNVLIDLAHMSEQSFNETVDVLGNKPIFVSHANAREVCDNGVDRNLSDAQLRTIGESGGVVGIMFARSFVNNPTADINDVVRHIKHIVNLAGEDSIAIGSDFGGLLSDPMVQGLQKFSDLLDFQMIIEKEFGCTFNEKLFSKNADRVIREYL